MSDDKGLTYHILDNDDICQLGKAFHGENGPAFFCNSDDLDAEYDMVHFGSVIQYISDFSGALTLCTNWNPKYILISDAMINEHHTFVTVADYYGSKHPHRFYEMEELLEQFRTFGYELVMSVPFVPYIRGKAEFYDMTNLPADYRVEQTAHLLFKQVAPQ